jgi:hypothetical protein
MIYLTLSRHCMSRILAILHHPRLSIVIEKCITCAIVATTGRLYIYARNMGERLRHRRSSACGDDLAALFTAAMVELLGKESESEGGEALASATVTIGL